MHCGRTLDLHDTLLTSPFIACLCPSWQGVPPKSALKRSTAAGDKPGPRTRISLYGRGGAEEEEEDRENLEPADNIMAQVGGLDFGMCDGWFMMGGSSTWADSPSTAETEGAVLHPPGCWGGE